MMMDTNIRLGPTQFWFYAVTKISSNQNTEQRIPLGLFETFEGWMNGVRATCNKCRIQDIDAPNVRGISDINPRI